MKQTRRDFLSSSLSFTAAGLILPTVLAAGVSANPSISLADAKDYEKQGEWRFCGKCFMLFWNGNPDKGRCPGGGAHLMGNGSFNFWLPYDLLPVGQKPVLTFGDQQPLWRFCQKCHVMFYDGFPGKGTCAFGGAHSAYGYDFVLPHDRPGNAARQAEWRWCKKCYAMFWNGWQQKGKCPGGSGHEAYGYNFVLPVAADSGDIRIRMNVTTTGWAPIGGWCEVSANQNGACSFSGHIHNSGGVNIRFTLAAALITPSGYSYGFANVGKRVDGTETLFDRNRDNNWNQNGSNPDISKNWHEVARSQLTWRLVASSEVTQGIRNYLEKVVWDVYSHVPGGDIKDHLVGRPLEMILTL